MNDEQQIIEPVPTMAGYKKIPTFKLWIANQFPYIETDFDAITNYELLQAVIKYLNTIIENENNVESNVTALYNSFVNLHDYVKNYFDNLDVQEEVNNKLDEMVEDGTLESILLNYTQTTKAYDTYNDMILDTSAFVNGMKIKTLGYHFINDNGGAEYIVTNVQNDNKYQVSVGTNLYLELISEELLNVKQFGAYGDDQNDDTQIIQLAIDKAKILNKKLYFPKGIYVTSTPIILYEEMEILGEDRRNTRIKKTTNTTGGKNNINAVIICENSNGIERNYTQGQKIKNIGISSTSKIADYGIYSHTSMPFTEFYNLSIGACKTGIHYNSGSWQSVAREIHITGCNNGIVYKNTGTSSVFENIYVWEPEIGFDFTGLGYSTLSNLAVDRATNTPYKFTGCNVDINGLGSESPNYSGKVIAASNSYVIIKSGYIYVNETAQAVFDVHNGIVDFRGSIGYNNQNDVNTSICKFGNNATLILRNCNIYCNFLINPKTISVNDGRNNLKIIDGQANLTYSINNEFNTIGDNNNKSKNLGTKLGISYVPPSVNGNCFNGMSNAIDYNREWSSTLIPGTIGINSSGYSSGIAFFQTVTPNKNLYLASSIMYIDGNTITLENLNFTPQDAKYDYPLRTGVKLTNGNGATGTIASITDNSITFSSVTGTFNVGDQLYIPAPQYIRDQSHRAVQHLLQGTSANRPVKPRTGLQYFDTTLGKPIWYNNNRWVDSTGANV